MQSTPTDTLSKCYLFCSQAGRWSILNKTKVLKTTHFHESVRTLISEGLTSGIDILLKQTTKNQFLKRGKVVMASSPLNCRYPHGERRLYTAAWLLSYAVTDPE